MRLRNQWEMLTVFVFEEGKSRREEDLRPTLDLLGRSRCFGWHSATRPRVRWRRYRRRWSSATSRHED